MDDSLAIDGNTNAGGGANTGNRAIIYAASEMDIVSGTLDVFGFGPGVLIPGFGAGMADDVINVNNAATPGNFSLHEVDVDNESVGQLLSVNIIEASFVQNGAPDPARRPGLIVNGGDEAAVDPISGRADLFEVTASVIMNTQVNGNLPDPLTIGPDGLPQGDQLTLISPSSINVFSDKATPPNVTTTFGNNIFGIRDSSIERVLMIPGNGVLNLFGDNNDTGVDQNDNFVLVGRNVDFPGDVDAGVGEGTLVINGSAPRLFDSVSDINAFGDDQNPPPGFPSTGNDIDTLEITPYADDTTRGWGIDVSFDEGNPPGADGAQADLIILHTVLLGGDVSEHIEVKPSGPDNGEIVVTNSSDGSLIVDVDYVANTDIIIVDNDGALNDTDTVTLYGTDGTTPQTSGNETFVTDFDAPGAVATPQVTVTDTNSGTILYRVRSLTGIEQVNYAGGDGNDTFNFASPAAAAYANGVEQLNVSGGLGNDTVTYNVTGRGIGSGVALNFDGGAGADAITATGTPTVTPLTSITYNVGPNVGEGQVILNDGVAPVTIDFQNLEPAALLIPTTNLIINATASANAISYSQSPANAAWGRVTVDGFELMDFANATTLTINGGAGSDEISLNNATTPTGLTGITVNGGDPTAGSDVAIINGTTAADAINFTPTTNDDAVVTGAGPVAITLATIEQLIINGQGGGDVLTATTPAGADEVEYVPGDLADAGSIQIADQTAGPERLLPLAFQDLGSNGNVTIADAGAIRVDDLFVDGTNNGDTFNVTAAGVVQIRRAGSGVAGEQITLPINTPGVDQLVLHGLNGGDNFNIPGNHPFTDPTPNAIVIQGGSPDSGSDVLNFTGAGAAITANPGAATITETGFAPVAYSGIETANIAAATANLTVIATASDDVVTYTPQGANSGQVQANDAAPVVNFTATAVFNISTLGAVGDVVVVNGTSNHDTITVNSPTRTVTVINAAGTMLEPVVLNNNVEQVKVQSGLGNDTILVVPGAAVAATAAPQLLPTNLLVEVDGGPPGASDALVIANGVGGAILPASDFVVHARGRSADEGRIRVFRNLAPLPDISYTNVEIVSPLVTVNANPAIGPQLLQMGPDLFEQNESFQNATHLGSFDTINLENLAIFPDLGEHPFVPVDTDFFEVIAKETGTLDFRILFNTYAGLLPGGGDIDIRVLDENGTIIGGAGAPAANAGFGVPNAANPTAVPAVAAGNNADERVRIPVVAGQKYYLQVIQAPGTPRFNTNGYDLTITNEAAPTPYDLEINDNILGGAVAGAPAPAVVGANTQLSVVPNPGLTINPRVGFYVGRTIHFLTGANAGLSLPITVQPALTRIGVATAGLRGPITAADTFLIESSNTGRSQNDNVSNDATPLIIFRLDDDTLLRDVPGNPAPGGPTPDQVTRIPWNNTYTAVAAAATAGPFSVAGQVAGYRVAIYEEGTTTPGGPGPNGLWGYATMVAPGVYQFDFANTATNNLFGPALLTNGSHFLTARAEIIDPAAAPGLTNTRGPGVRSESFELFVDTATPPVAFGNLISAVDGLHPDSDSAVSGVVPPLPAFGTNVDRVTNDTTPAFWGTAEANTIVRAYLDIDATGTVTGPDILLGQNTAIPNDGTNQAPFGQWQITSAVDLNDPAVLAVLAAPLDGLRPIIISAEDPAGNLALPAGAATPQQVLNIFIDTQGPRIYAPASGQAIQIANPAPQGANNGINNFNIFTNKSAAAAIAPTPLANGLIINVRDLPNRIAGWVYNAIQNPATGGPLIAPLAGIAPNAGAAAIAALAPIHVPAVVGALALNPADFSVVGDATGAAPILSAYFVPTTGAIPPAAPATGYIVLTFRSAAAGAALPDDRYSLNISDNLVDPANNKLDGENNGVNVVTGNTQPGGPFNARFTVDSRPEAAVFGQDGVFVDANQNWVFDPNNTDIANHDLVFDVGIDTDFVFAGKFSANQATNGYDKLGGYGLLGGAYRWLLDTTDNGIADTVVAQPTGFAVGGITYTGNGIPFAGNFTGAVTTADEIGIFDGINWFLDTNHNNVIDAADTAFTGNMRGLPIVGDFDGDGIDDLGTHFASTNRFQFDFGNNGYTGNATAGQNITYGFSGVLERPVVGDINADGIDDIGLGVPNQDGPATDSTMSWYILQSTGIAPVGTNTSLNHAFSSVPVGLDLFQQFGNNIAVPLLGNFDPPPVAGTDTNTAPIVLAPAIAQVAEADGSAEIAISITDSDGDALTTTAVADSMAWHLDQTMELYSVESYFYNYFGANEKWIKNGENRWLFITETGGLFRWDGRKSATGVLVATLDSSYHADPTLLTEAQRVQIPVQVQVDADSLTVIRQAGFDASYVVTITGSDGQESVTTTVSVDTITGAAIRLDSELSFHTTGNYWENWGGLNEKWFRDANDSWYFITPDGTVTMWGRQGGATGVEIATLDPTFHANPELLLNAAELDASQEYQFYSGTKDWFNWGGQNEKWIKGEDNRWFYIVENGDIYRWDGSKTASGTLVTSVDSSYYSDTTRFYKAVDDVFANWMDLMTF